MDILGLAQRKCKEWHKGQQRKYTGDPYHVHPFEVAKILKDIGASDEVIAAGYLHDVIEDCNVNKYALIAEFGLRVADLVMMVTDVSKPEDGNRKRRKAMDRDHIAKADADGQTIKLADLISNTSSIVKYDPGFAKVYLGEKAELLEVMTKGNRELHSRASDFIITAA